MRANFGPLVVIAAAVFCFAQTAPATTIAPTPLPEMVQASPSIVHGTVTATSSRWNADHTMIVTDVTVQVHDVLRGDDRRRVVFTQPGGSVGAVRVDVPGASAFQAGEEAVFFLAPGGEEGLYLYGLDRGRFAVSDVDGEKLVRGLDEMELGVLLAVPEGVVSTSSRATGGAIKLSDFKAGVRRLRDAPPPRDNVRDGGER